MSTAFEGPRRKLQRARLHIEALRFHERRFFNTGAYAVTGEPGPEPGHHLFKLSIKEPLPAERFASIIGDTVHNLRSALDHLSWQLAQDFHGANRRTQFPAFTDKEVYERDSPRYIGKLGPHAQARVRQFQPFHVPGREVTHPLWLIADLDNRDKHQDLNVTASTIRGTAGKLFTRPGETGRYELTLNQEDLADGDAVGELVIDPPDTDIRVELVWDFGVVLTEPSVPYVRPRAFANRLLYRCASWVEGVLDAFEAFYVGGAYDDDAPLPPIESYHWPPPPADDALTWDVWTKDDAYHAEFAQTALRQMKESLREDPTPDDLEAASVGFRIGVAMAADRANADAAKLIEHLTF